MKQYTTRLHGLALNLKSKKKKKSIQVLNEIYKLFFRVVKRVYFLYSSNMYFNKNAHTQTKKQSKQNVLFNSAKRSGGGLAKEPRGTFIFQTIK